MQEIDRERVSRRTNRPGGSEQPELALAAVLTLGACKATGGGQIDEPVPSGVLPTVTWAAPSPAKQTSASTSPAR